MRCCCFFAVRAYNLSESVITEYCKVCVCLLKKLFSSDIKNRDVSQKIEKETFLNNIVSIDWWLSIHSVPKLPALPYIAQGLIRNVFKKYEMLHRKLYEVISNVYEDEDITVATTTKCKFVFDFIACVGLSRVLFQASIF